MPFSENEYPDVTTSHVITGELLRGTVTTSLSGSIQQNTNALHLTKTLTSQLAPPHVMALAPAGGSAGAGPNCAQAFATKIAIAINRILAAIFLLLFIKPDS